MHFITRPIATAHQNADCPSVTSKQPGKPRNKDQNKLQRIQEPNNMPQNNVISLAAVRKPARHVDTAKFKYPMLECS